MESLHVSFDTGSLSFKRAYDDRVTAHHAGITLCFSYSRRVFKPTLRMICCDAVSISTGLWVRPIEKATRVNTPVIQLHYFQFNSSSKMQVTSENKMQVQIM